MGPVWLLVVSLYNVVDWWTALLLSASECRQPSWKVFRGRSDILSVFHCAFLFEYTLGGFLSICQSQRSVIFIYLHYMYISLLFPWPSCGISRSQQFVYILIAECFLDLVVVRVSRSLHRRCVWRGNKSLVDLWWHKRWQDDRTRRPQVTCFLGIYLLLPGQVYLLPCTFTFISYHLYSWYQLNSTQVY